MHSGRRVWPADQHARRWHLRYLRRGRMASLPDNTRCATTQSRSAIMTSAKGLEGVAGATTNISHVFGEEGRLVYSGYEISELAGAATLGGDCFSLWTGRPPKRSQLEDLRAAQQPHRGV